MYFCGMIAVGLIIIGAIIAYKVHKKIEDKSEKIIAAIMIFAGISFGVGVFLDLTIFLTLVLITNFLIGILEVLLIALMFDLSMKKASLFQFIIICISVIPEVIFQISLIMKREKELADMSQTSSGSVGSGSGGVAPATVTVTSGNNYGIV